MAGRAQEPFDRLAGWPEYCSGQVVVCCSFLILDGNKVQTFTDAQTQTIFEKFLLNYRDLRTATDFSVWHLNAIMNQSTEF